MDKVVAAKEITSGPSRKACCLRFINKTCRKANVIWIDYNGTLQNYGTLDPKRHFDIHTYEGHPWISEDAVTKNRLLLNHSKVFYPTWETSILVVDPSSDDRNLRIIVRDEDDPAEPNSEIIENNGTSLKRQFVFITLPVFSLQELSSEAIVKNVRSCVDIRSLKLPVPLQKMLQSRYFR